MEQPIIQLRAEWLIGEAIKELSRYEDMDNYKAIKMLKGILKNE